MKTNETTNNQLEALREMVINAAQETNDADLLDLVWRILARSGKGGV